MHIRLSISVVVLITLTQIKITHATCTNNAPFMAGQVSDIFLVGGTPSTNPVTPYYVTAGGTDCGVYARSTVPGTSIADVYGCPGTGCASHGVNEWAAVNSAYGGGAFGAVAAGMTFTVSFDGTAPVGTQGFIELAANDTDIGLGTLTVFARIPVYVDVSSHPNTWFTVTSNVTNVTGDHAIIDHPYLNGNASAILFVSHNWNPSGGAGSGWNHPISVLYDTTAARWTIRNMDSTSMPTGVSFSVRIDPTGHRTCVKRATSSIPDTDITSVGHNLATVFATEIGGTGHNSVVVYSTTQNMWVIEYADQTLLAAGSCFFIKTFGLSQYINDPSQQDLSFKSGTTNDNGLGVDMGCSGTGHCVGGVRILPFNWNYMSNPLPMIFAQNANPINITPIVMDNSVYGAWFSGTSSPSNKLGIRREDGAPISSAVRFNVWIPYQSNYPPY